MTRLGRTVLPAVAVLTLACAAAPVDAQGGALAGTLVVGNKGAASVNIIDVESGRMLATLPTGSGPHEVTITGDGRVAVVGDYGGQTAGSTLTVIDVPGLAVARTIDLGRFSRPHGLEFLPGDSILAVTSETTRSVVLVRVADGEIVGVISTDHGGSHMLAVVANGSRIYTGDIADNTVSELDVATGQRTRSFGVAPQPEAITVTPSGDEVWVGSNAEGSVSVVTPGTGETDPVLTGFAWPYRILITPDQRRVLIPDLRRNELRVFDRATRQQIHVIDLAGTGPQGITLSADASVAFLSLSQRNQVAVIDLATYEIRRHITTGAAPDGIAYTSLLVAQ